jgi:hypothetical protein
MKTSFLHLLSTAALLLTVIPQGASAKPPVPITGAVDVKTGMTSVVLDDSFKTTLSDLGAETKKIIPGQFVKGHQTYRFPIRGGAFDLSSLQAEIIHSGGVNISTESVRVSLTDFIITLPAPVEEPSEPAVDPVTGEPLPVEPPPVPTLSALVTVDGHLLGRIALFELEAPALSKPHTLPPNKKLSLENLPLSLTAEGAETLNTAFGVATFVEDAAVGSASVRATTAKRPL